MGRPALVARTQGGEVAGSRAPAAQPRRRQISTPALESGAARDRLTDGIYLPKGEADATAVLEAAFLAAIACEPIEKKLRKAVKSGALEPRSGVDTAQLARDKGVITPEEFAQWQKKEALRKRVIMVDDFPQDFGRAEIMEALGEAKPVHAKAA